MKRRETGIGSREADFGVVFDSSEADEECVSIVAVHVVKEEEVVVVSSHPAQRNFLRWRLLLGYCGRQIDTYMYHFTFLLYIQNYLFSSY